MRTTRKSSLHTALPFFLITPLALALALALVFASSSRVVAEDTAFEGVVVEEGVKVRAGAGRTFYIVGSLKKGAKVHVGEVIFGWNKVAAPDGVFSFISKAFVDARGDGSVGKVNRDKAPINAASLVAGRM